MIRGLCPRCLLALGLEELNNSSTEITQIRTKDSEVWPSPGQLLGDRYEIRSLLGRGGMGEVWHAFDVKLRVDVALKALRPEYFDSETRRVLLREEVRSAREVMSPNVCRVFDLIVEKDRELVSMEYIDGTTLLKLLENRGPLSLREAGELASQFLSGLEAVHRVGLVHRDFKPENVMITRTGRVVVMDFGVAKRTESGAGTVAGTPAYMAPEQGRGEAVDARADIFSAGLVLAEMIAEEGIRDPSTRESLWEGVRQEPPILPPSPWHPVLQRAVSKDPAGRYPSARALMRALEEVTLRVEGSEEKRPYPGLSSYTEEDAEHFFGREVEVEAMWRKLERPHLLALIGPSGAVRSNGAFVADSRGTVQEKMTGFSANLYRVAVDPQGRLAAAVVNRGPTEDKVIRVLDLESGEVQLLGPPDGVGEGAQGTSYGLKLAYSAPSARPRRSG